MAELAKLGRYELRRVLGKGAMGVVYEGYDPMLSRRVAVKTILKSVALDDETERSYGERFVREAKAVARLNHPHIVQVHDFGVENEVAYLVMEFIQGRELRGHFTDGERFDTADAVRIMGELLDALDFAHEAGVIHRDIKPANVMLDSQRRVKLADFGVARVQDSERSAAGTMVGTPAFMSPEQISGGKIDRRTDIFSAGTILYQLLTGKQPFSGEGAWTVARQIMQDNPQPPSSVVVSVSPAFDAVVNKALAKEPAQRYSRAREFAAALRGVLAPGAQATVNMAPAAKARPEPKASETELEFWRAIQNSTDAAEFEFYLEQFPEGTYAALARHKIARLREPAEAARKEAEEKARQDTEAKEQGRKVAEERAKAEAAARAKKEAEELARREAEAKARRAAAERMKQEADEKARQAQALAKLGAQEQARAKAALDEDATVAIGKTRPSAAERKSSYALASLAVMVVVAVGFGAYVFFGRKPALVPVAEVFAPAPVVAPRAEVSAADVENVRKETEERVRREYADKLAAEQAAATKLAAERAAQERQTAARVAAEKAAAEKTAEAARKATEKVASAKSAQEKAALEKAAAIEKAAAERAAAAERVAVAAERAAAERVAAADKAARAASEKAIEEKAAAARTAARGAAPAAAAPARATSPEPVPREGGLPGRYSFRLFAGSGGWPACDRIDVNEDVEFRGGGAQSVSGKGFADLRIQSNLDGSVAATVRSIWTPFGSGDAKLAGRATAAGFAGTYDWRWSAVSCAGRWTLVRKSG